ncbi:MAG TPA: ABC transporter permease [Myxococcota bacterium]|nr:ABC transporter permease [Myxococcota bacterium]HRY93998.1 ABC transporter permease [Myxococcota bacterium]
MRFAFWRRTGAMAHKEALHLSRDRQAVYMALGMPVLLLALFGYAVTFDLQRLSLGLDDQDRSPTSWRLGQAFTASGAFEVAGRVEPGDAEAALRRGAVKAVLHLPRGLERDLQRGQPAELQLVLDGADGNTAAIAMGYAAGIVQAEAERILREAGAVGELPIQARVWARFNPAMESAKFIVPGLIAMILAIMAVLLTALTVAREWERGSMEQLFTTPVGRLEIVLGKLAPYIVLGMVQVLLVVTVGCWLFDVPIRGSLVTLFGASALFLACMLGQGLLISVLTRNQMVSVQVGMITSMLPTLLLSGFVFPIENMPVALQAFTYAFPARYFMQIIRGVMLKGSGLEALWPQLLSLAGLAVLLVLLATARFRRRLA